MATIKVKWHYINWDTGNKWQKDIVPKLKTQGIALDQLDRAVYIIRTTGKFAIDYLKKYSPVLYIGEGDLKQRLTQHKNWLKELSDLVGDFPIEIVIAIPRARNNSNIYKDMEADLLHKFKEIHGLAPFMNKQMEYHGHCHNYEPKNEFTKPLQVGHGKRIPWAISPLPSNKHYSDYWKTED